LDNFAAISTKCKEIARKEKKGVFGGFYRRRKIQLASETKTIWGELRKRQGGGGDFSRGNQEVMKKKKRGNNLLSTK